MGGVWGGVVGLLGVQPALELAAGLTLSGRPSRVAPVSRLWVGSGLVLLSDLAGADASPCTYVTSDFVTISILSLLTFPSSALGTFGYRGVQRGASPPERGRPGHR